MKHLFNQVPYKVFRRQSLPTSYPYRFVDDKGRKQIMHRKVLNNDLIAGETKDFKLSNLLNAGVDPSHMVINTSSSRIDSCTRLDAAMSQVSFSEDNPSND